MKKLFFLLLFCNSIISNAADKDSTTMYVLPDSIKAVQFMAEINIKSINPKKSAWTGIRTDAATLAMTFNGNKSKIFFECYGEGTTIVTGIQTMQKSKGEIVFDYNLLPGNTYKLMISVASDSAENFSLYSGYAFLPEQKKWKLIGTYKITGRWNTLQQPSVFCSPAKKGLQVTPGEAWVQRNNGSWKNLGDKTSPFPVINLYNHADSLQQSANEIKYITDRISAQGSPLSDVKVNSNGIFYKIMKEGTGRKVTVEDTVVAYYKGYLFSNDQVFDQTKEKPATFPLQRLIKGWQLGLPLCNVGGKIKLIIPSGLGYSIRTRAAKIPPNSILVFEIEVMEAKKPAQ